MTEPPPPFDTLSLPTKLPRDFEVIVQRCLAKRPEQRYQTMTDLMLELERLSLSLRSPSRPSIETMLPLAPLVPFEEEARNTGNSVPAAPGRSVMAQPKRRSFALFFSALGLATLTGISLLRMQEPEELHSAGAARSARGPAALPPGESGAAAGVDALREPLATATASLASTPGPAIGPAPAAPVTGGDAKGAAAPPTSDTVASSPTPSTTEAASAAVDGELEDSGQLTMEPLTVVELAPGKSVEIEARTRLSLRLTKDGRAGEPGVQRSPRKGPKGKGPARANADSERDGGKAGASNAAGSKARPSKAGSGKGGGKPERDAETRAPSELMNPWPSPVVGQ